jgi:hypothetical protein
MRKPKHSTPKDNRSKTGIGDLVLLGLFLEEHEDCPTDVSVADIRQPDGRTRLVVSCAACHDSVSVVVGRDVVALLERAREQCKTGADRVR